MRTRFKAIITMSMLICSVSLWGTTYYIAASGSDSNNGTSKTTAWLHAPGMPACTAVCAATTPKPGDQFIFRGGDSWHGGNSSSSPYVGGTWSWSWNGSSSSPIYLGVDQTWFSGSSWSRPILDGDNPLSTSAVASCAYPDVGKGNIIFTPFGTQYVTVDNFELRGLCQRDAPPVYGNDLFINDGGTTHLTFKNLYIHGWTHVPFSGVCTGIPSGHCFNVFAFSGNGGAASQLYSVYTNIVIDGSDSDPNGAGTFYNTGYDIHDSVMRYASQMLMSNNSIFHDNLVEYWYSCLDGAAHANVLEHNDEPHGDGPHVMYNNIFRHIAVEPGACAEPVIIWTNPGSGTTRYDFNNLIYDAVGGNNFWNVEPQSGAQEIVFNNTLNSASANPIFECTAASGPLATFYNNHLISDEDVRGGNGAQCSPFTTGLVQTQAQASASGYTKANVEQPTSQTSPTVAKGTNRQTYCSALSSAGLTDAAIACESDTTWACTYDTNNHTVSCPARTAISRPASAAWDVGVYQFVSSGSGQPAPPTGLAVLVR